MTGCADGRLPIGIPKEGETKRVHLMGSAGVGMSTLFRTMVVTEFRRGHAAILLVPRGTTCDVSAGADRDSKEHLESPSGASTGPSK
jgi:hypothetical protein